MTPLELWRLKRGYAAPKDLSGNAAVQQGVKMEPILRSLFSSLHPEYKVEHYPYDILWQEERCWLFASLDGELTDDHGRRGILEIKTATPTGKVGWEQWSNGRMPQHYMVQCVHQLAATGFDFVRLFAALYSLNGDITLREYEIEREDVAADIEWLVEQETRFWGHVVGNTEPPMPLTL